MFWWSNVELKGLKEDVQLLTKANEGLKKEKMQLKEEVEELKLKKRLEQEEIVHLQKINSEKVRMEVDTKKIELERLHNEKITKFKEEQTAALLQLTKELHGKLEGRFNVELGNLKEIYQALMARLPNVNLTLEKKLR